MEIMRTAGIIGGFGPEATAKFQLEIVEIFRALKVKTRPPLLIWQTPIPIQIEKNLVLKSKDLSKFLPFLIEGAQRLKKGGADFLVLPCNTLHILINDLRKSIDLPIVNLIEETAKKLNKEGINKIGIIANQAMIKSGLHQQCLLSKGIEPILPQKHDRFLINTAIAQILANKNFHKIEKMLLQVNRNLRARGAKNILLACTDLQLVFPKTKEVKVHDTLKISAEATVKEILKGGE